MSEQETISKTVECLTCNGQGYAFLCDPDGNKSTPECPECKGAGEVEIQLNPEDSLYDYLGTCDDCDREEFVRDYLNRAGKACSICEKCDTLSAEVGE